jgi:hypothetical protein
MTDAQFRINVINVIIGSLGDISSSHVETIKMAVQLRSIINSTEVKKKEVDEALSKASPTVSISSTYDKFVDNACEMIGKSRSEVEREAFDDKFRDLESS